MLVLLIVGCTSFPNHVGAPRAFGFQLASGMVLVANPTSGLVPLLVEFNLTLPSGPPANLSWSFGDGQWLNGSSDSVARPGHEYGSAGGFVAEVWARWSSGTLNDTVVINAYLSNLSVTVNASANRGVAPLTVWLNGTPSGGSGTYLSELWAFGDGKSGSGNSVRYTFTIPGDYRPTLTVTDSRHSAKSGALWVNVSAPTGTGGKPGPAGASPSGHPLSFTWPVFAGLLGAGVASVVVVVAWARWSRRRHGIAPTAAQVSPPSPTPEPMLFPKGRGGAVEGLTEPPKSSAPIGSGTSGGPVAASSSQSTSTQAGPGPSAPIVLAATRQLTYGLVRHLATLPRWSPGDLPSTAWTQAGIAESLGVGQSTVSRILRRLEAAGAVASETSHVSGSARRMRVYRLTGQGERLGRALRETDLEKPRPGPPVESPSPPRRRERALGASDAPAVANQ